MGDLQRDLRRPEFDVIETHTAWVFLGEEIVWKVKKPVDFGFLDFRTLAARRAACEAEMRLNARLSSHVYEGVVPITRDATGTHRIGGRGDPVDYAVQMRRLADATRADVLLSKGALTAEHLEKLAARLAVFHSNMPTSEAIAAFGTPESVLGNVRENFAQTRATVREHLSAEHAAEIEAKQVLFVEQNRALFEERIRAGRIRDGHGDLRLEHVYFEGDPGPTIIDCIEFNERFRYADVCADVAFLSMDLERLGRVDLAERFLAAYARASGDYDAYRLVDFYEGYRAYVRGKVSSLLAADAGADLDTRARASFEARNYFLLSLGQGRRRILGPSVVAVGGIIASGKSTIADRLGALMSAPVVDADRTRKSLLGVDATRHVVEAAFGGAYSSAFTERVYAEVLGRADAVLSSGRPVILDASFRSRGLRALSRELAARYGVPFHFVECRVSLDEARRRLVERAKGEAISDGRAELLDEFVAKFEPVSELPSAEHIVVDTTLPIDDNLTRLERALPTWPRGFNG